MKDRTWIGTIMLVGAILLAGCTRDAGMPRNPLSTPEETVKAYCGLDANGTRLTSATWSKVLPYISWPEEAGFDRAVIISGFSIDRVQKKSETKTVVHVEYLVLGTLSGEYTADRRTETVRFTVTMTDRGWKIVGPEFLPPHVLAKAMVKHLEGMKQNELAEKVKNDL